MKRERYQLDRSRILKAMEGQTVGGLLHKKGQACFDEDFKTPLKLEDIGVLADVKPGTFHHYLYHHMRASRAVCERVAGVLGCDVDQILTDASAVDFLRLERRRLSDWARNYLLTFVTVLSAVGCRFLI